MVVKRNGWAANSLQQLLKLYVQGKEEGAQGQCWGPDSRLEVAQHTGVSSLILEAGAVKDGCLALALIVEPVQDEDRGLKGVLWCGCHNQGWNACITVVDTQHEGTGLLQPPKLVIAWFLCQLNLVDKDSPCPHDWAL